MKFKEFIGNPEIYFHRGKKIALLLHIEHWDATCGKDGEYNQFRIYFLFWELNLIFKK